MGLLHVASSPLNSSVVFAVTRLFSRWFQSIAVLMNKEFLYCSVLGCSTTTTIFFILFIFIHEVHENQESEWSCICMLAIFYGYQFFYSVFTIFCY